MGIDKVGIDKVGIDEVGRYLVYNHHFRDLFNLKYPATVDSFGSLTCITIVSMVTSFMARINFMMSYFEITDRLMSTCPIFPSESVQTLFFGESAGCMKNLVRGQDCCDTFTRT